MDLWGRFVLELAESSMMMRDGGRTAIMFGRNTAGRTLRMLNLTKVRPGFPGIKAGAK